MQFWQKTAKLILLLGVLSLIFPRRAYAYIDPGTGSYFIQVAIAGLLATSYALKVYWRRIMGALRAPFRKGGGDEADGR